MARLRVDVVGSLLRPARLKDARARFDRGDLDEAGLRTVEDEEVRSAIQREIAAGLPIVTDGEFRRLNFQDSFGASVDGFAAARDTASFHTARSAGGAPGQRWDPGYTGAGPAIVHRRPVSRRLSLRRNLPLEEFRFAQAAAGDTPAKVSLIGVDRITQRFAYEESTAIYADVDAFVADVVAIQREMVGGLVDAGSRYVHVDEPAYTAYVDAHSLEQMRARGEDPSENLARSIRADNAVIAGLRERGVTTAVHLCRGNQAGMWHREGAYDAIAEPLFGGLEHERLLLEYDTERAGSFAPLRFVPEGKVVVLGVVTTKSPVLEDPDALKRRIDEAARYVPIERLAISPQCGFASDTVGNPLSEDDQWRKLELLVRVAEDVWGAG